MCSTRTPPITSLKCGTAGFLPRPLGPRHRAFSGRDASGRWRRLAWVGLGVWLAFKARGSRWKFCINIKIPLNSFNIWMVGSLKNVLSKHIFFASLYISLSEVFLDLILAISAIQYSPRKCCENATYQFQNMKSEISVC